MKTQADTKNLINYAHRGASAYRPENTEISFDLGLEMGANGIETDVQMTNDGVLVLFHDDEMGRTSNAKGKIIDYSYEQLKKFDFGGWFDEKYVGTQIKTFEKFAEKYFSLPIDFAIELKSSNCEKATLQIINDHNARDKVIITSFNYEFLKKVRQLDGEIAIGWLVDTIDGEKLQMLTDIDGNQICPKASNTSAEKIAQARQMGFSVRLWGISNEQIMNQAYTMDVDGMTVNFPDKLLTLMNKG